jgi:hypothetical protein
MKLLLAGLLVAGAWVTPAWAESPVDGCKSAIEAFEDEDIELALEEARWCVELLEQQKQASVADSFKDSVAGYTGGETETQKAMGMMITTRSYSKGDSSVTVSLTQTSSESAMSGFGALASMGMMGAGQKVRVRGNTGTFIKEGRDAQLMITPRSGGGLLNFESSDLDQAGLTGFAEDFLKDVEGF